MNVLNFNSAYMQANFNFQSSQDVAKELSGSISGIEAIINKQSNQDIQNKAASIDPQALTNSYAIATFSFSSDTFKVQGSLNDIFGNSSDIETQRIQGLLATINEKSIGYQGKPLYMLDKDQAASLISEDGFFGVKNTANRIADFVLGFAGDNENLLRQGRSGMLKGFNEAGKIWGQALPEISQETMKLALQKVDQKISQVGTNKIDFSV